VPELPEVETIRRQLGPELVGRQVVGSWAFASAKFTQATEVDGAWFGSSGRRGKYLILELEDGRELVVHLGMTGVLRFADPTVEPDPYVRAWWLLDDGRRFEFSDVRRFGRVVVVDAGEYSGIATLHAMGPEPFDDDFGPTEFWNRLRRSNQMLKTNLLSQRPIAGVGNIYADEALFLARINPAVRSISKPKAERLLACIREVLGASIDRGGTTLKDYRSLSGAGENQLHLLCYGRAGEPCVRCGAELRHRVIDARSTSFCPVCQKR
jgi:formamidopyrimidine-DNA glycosylase